MRTKRRIPVTLLLVILAALPLSCGGGGGGGGGALRPDASSDLVLLTVNVEGESGVPINEIIDFEFSAVLDPLSVGPATIRILRGPDFGAHAAGTFEVDGSRVRFYPDLPRVSDLSDAGLRPGTAYRIVLPGAPGAATLRNVDGARLLAGQTVNFQTADVSQGLFRDNFGDVGRPSVVRSTPEAGGIDLPTVTPVEIEFNQRPLDPATVTAENIKLILVSRDGRQLERRVQGAPVLDQDFHRVVVRFVPVFPLSDRSTYRITVGRRTLDLVGNDAVPFSAEFTTKDEPLLDRELLLEFDAAERLTRADLDLSTAAWGEDERPNELVARFTAAGGDGTAGDLNPTDDVTISLADYPGGASIETIDGVPTEVYRFRSIEIPKDVTVAFRRDVGSQSRPIQLLALKDIRIDGTIDVSGGAGSAGETNSRSFSLPANPGGSGGPGGADGADAYAGSSTTSIPRMNGDDVTFGGGGGVGGSVGTNKSYSYSGGGGGGGARLAGAPGTRGGYTFDNTRNGTGGDGGLAAVSRGNDTNEARRPNVGGAGGGAGAHGFYFSTYRNGAGSGGGGGGAITVQGAADIVLGETGRIVARGGPGGNSTTSSTYYGGAGGGGAGGSILIRATGTAEFAASGVLDVSGGVGGAYLGTYAPYTGGQGGTGGQGYLRVEAGPDKFSTPRIVGLNAASSTYPPSEGAFTPRGGGAPSSGVTIWIDLGVFDPVLFAPELGVDSTASVFNDKMTIWVQMAVEDPTDFTKPDLSAVDLLDADDDGDKTDTLDPSRVSEWVGIRNVAGLKGKGYRFVRIRVTFQLDENQGPDDPLPGIGRLRLPYKY